MLSLPQVLEEQGELLGAERTGLLGDCNLVKARGICREVMCFYIRWEA